MARLDLSLLGGFHASVDGSPVAGFDTDKTRALLIYVSVEPSRAHSRETLAGLLWSELPDDAAKRNLRNSLFKLRQALGEEEGSQAFLQITPQTVRLDPAADCRLDSAAFSALVAATATHRHRKPWHCATCFTRLRDAAELYRGDFLAGFHLSDSQAFEEWRVLKREALHREALDALVRLAAYHQARGEYEQALRYAYREIELEPWREEAHRSVMRLLALTERRSEALAQYVACRRALAQELDAEPGEETTALHELIKAGNLQPEETIAARHNLPRQLSPFIGRKSELARVIEQLDSPDYGLITLIGPGGVGKTRLALQVAAQQVGAFDDGVYWIPLASMTSPDTVAESIAQAAGLHLQPGEDPRAQLLNYLRDKEMLLLLDNFEQLLGTPGTPGTGGASDLVGSILKHAPRTSILVTSRERLGLQGEFLLDLSGLPFPREAPFGHSDPPDGRPDPRSPIPDPRSYDAVQLFVERARQARPDFALADEEAPVAIEICRLVEGLPLGIVLAAPWVRYFPLARIAASIKANLDFLRSSTRGDLPQHSSLRAVFDHSWALLPEEERRIFRGLSVFRGGWEEAAAERVAGASLHALLSLVDKSLLRHNAPERFGMHEVLRQYAAEKLDELPAEREEVQRLHAAYYLELAEQAEAGMGSGQQGEWFDRLEREHDNLRAVLQWAIDTEDAETGLRLGGALSRFWFVRGYFREGREALAAVLSPQFRVPSTEYRVPGDDSVLGTRHSELIRAKALRAAGDLDRARGDYAAARSLYEESLALYEESGDKKQMAAALVRLAIIVWDQGDLSLAHSLHEESLAISRELGDKRDIAVALGNLGLLAFMDGDYPTARSQLEESLAIDRELGDKFADAIRLNNLGNVALMQGDHAAARRLHTEGLALRRELKDRWGIAVSLIGIGGAAILAGEPEKGTRLLGAAEALLDAVGVALEADDRIPYEQATASARAQLTDQAFATARAEGRAMDPEDAINYALP